MIKNILIGALLFMASGTFAQVLTSKIDSVSYAVGRMVVRTLQQQGIEDVNYDMITQAVRDGLEGKEQLLSESDAVSCLRSYVEDMNKAKHEENKLAGENFLSENAEREDIVVLPSGLQYEILHKGEGVVSPGPQDRISAHYHGTLIDGTVFDSSIERGQPLTFQVNNVIQGWQEALQLMKVGDKWKLYVPYNLAYGERSAGPQIKPYSALIFEIELLSIE